MATFQARVVLPYTTGLPSDVAVNTFSVISGPDPDTAVGDAFIAFYNEAGPIGKVAQLLSTLVSRETNACRIEFYEVNVAGGPAGSPIGVLPFTLDTTSSTQDLPPEVALCSSFAAGAAPGVSGARRRGRVYIGPLVASVNNGLGRPSTASVQIIADATEALATDLVALSVTLSVWSRTDSAMFPVTRGWVDDEFDTMRSRGRESTSRETWSL